MIKMYKTDMETGKFETTKSFERGTWINMVNPSENEISMVCENININSEFMKTFLKMQ